MINAYRTGELSLVYPLMRGVAPLLTGVIAIFWMQEWPGPVGWVGMALISLGVFALAFRPATLADPFMDMVARSPSRWPTPVSSRFTPSSTAAEPGWPAMPGRTSRGCSCWTRCRLPPTCWPREDADSCRRWRNAATAGLIGGGLSAGRLRDLGLGHDQGSSRPGRFAAGDVRAFRDSDRRPIAQGAPDTTSVGRSPGGRARRGVTEGGVTGGIHAE